MMLVGDFVTLDKYTKHFNVKTVIKYLFSTS